MVVGRRDAEAGAAEGEVVKVEEKKEEGMMLACAAAPQG